MVERKPLAHIQQSLLRPPGQQVLLEQIFIGGIPKCANRDLDYIRLRRPGQGIREPLLQVGPTSLHPSFIRAPFSLPETAINLDFVFIVGGGINIGSCLGCGGHPGRHVFTLPMFEDVHYMIGFREVWFSFIDRPTRAGN